MQYQRITSSLPLLRGRTLHYHQLRSSPIFQKSRFYLAYRHASSSGFFRLLNDTQRSLVEEERLLSKRAREVASQVSNVEVRESRFFDDILEEEEKRKLIDSTFSIVVAGEFNSGKSTVINALLGQKLLETGTLPTTDSVTILAGTTEALQTNDKEEVASSSSLDITSKNGITVYKIPSQSIPLLNDLTLVDTPGTNASLSLFDHTSRTLKLLPSADLILFVTSADRPLSESEIRLLKRIQSYRKQIVILINKMDILESLGTNYGQTEKQRVREFVTLGVGEILGANPTLFSISARDALNAKLCTPQQDDLKYGVAGRMWERSHFELLEEFLLNSLTQETKLVSKLLSPLGVTEKMVLEAADELKKRKKEVEVDVATLNLMKSQMQLWKGDMLGELRGEREEMKNIIAKEGSRARMLWETLGYLELIRLVMDKDLFYREWNGVMEDGRDIESGIPELVRESVEILFIKSQSQSQAVIEYLGKRPSIINNNLIGNISTSIRLKHSNSTQTSLFEKFYTVLSNALSNHDSSKEADQFLSSLRKTMLSSFSLHGSAICIGSFTAFQMIDLSYGLVSSSGLILLGLFTMSYQKRTMIQKYQSKLDKLSDTLESLLEDVTIREVEKVHKRILEGVVPYTRFVEAETETAGRLLEECEDILAASHSLRSKILKLSRE